MDDVIYIGNDYKKGLLKLLIIKLITSLIGFVIAVLLFLYLIENGDGIEKKIMTYIIGMVFLISLLVLISIFNKRFLKPRLRVASITDNSVRIERYNIKDKQIKSDDDILPKWLMPINPRGISYIYVTINLVVTDSDTYVCTMKKKKDNTEFSFSKKSDIKDSKFSMIVSVKEDEMLNFRFNKDTTIKDFSVIELYVPDSKIHGYI